MFKKISIILLSLVLCLGLLVGNVNAHMKIVKGADDAYIDYQTDAGVSIMKIDQTAGVTVTGGFSSTGNFTLTAPTTASNAVYGLINASASWTGNIVGVRGKVVVTATGAIVSATGVWAGLRLESASGPGSGLTCALNAEVYGSTAVYPNAIVYIQSLPSNTLTNFSTVPYIVFSETRTGGGSVTGSYILFEVGHNAAGTIPEIGTGELFYNHTLRIAVNETTGVRTWFYIPLSTAEGTYTSEYPVDLTYSGGNTIDITVTGTATAVKGLYSLVNAGTSWTSGDMVGVHGKVAITATSMSGAAGVWAEMTMTGVPVGNGLSAALQAEVSSNNAAIPNSIVYIQSLPGSSADFSNVPYIVFSETRGGATGTGSKILFEVGHNAAGTIPTIGSGELFYNHTLQIAVNESAGVRTAYYIVLSTAEGSLTGGTMANAVGSGVAITDHYSKIIGIYCDATADNSTVGAAAHELYGGEVRQLLNTSSGTYQGEQYAWKGTQRYYGANQVGSYSAALFGKLESAGALTVVGYAGCVAAAISDVQAGNFVLNGGYLYGFNAYINIASAHTGTGKSVAYLTSIIAAHNWDYGLFIPSLTCDTGVGIGDSTTAAAFTAAAERAISVYTTTNYTGSASCGSYFETAMTGVGGAGVGTEVYLKTSVALGNYVAALYAVLDLQTAGGVTGVGSAICGEIVMPGGAAGIGTFGVLKLDIVASASWTSSQRVSFIRARTSGSTGAKWITEGYVLDLNGMGTPVDDTSAVFHLIHNADVASTLTHALRILVDGVEYDIPLKVSDYSSN